LSKVGVSKAIDWVIENGLWENSDG